MTENEIIKTLECCSKRTIWEDCPVDCPMYQFDGDCFDLMQKDILALINRQKAKIEALQMDNKQLETDNFNANMNLEHLQAEIERLKLITTSNPYCVSIGTADIFTENHEEYEKLLAKISAEAIKEFAERLKGIYRTHEGLECEIDNLVKEMVGDAE